MQIVRPGGAWGPSAADAAWGGSAASAVLAVCCLVALWLVRALTDGVEPVRSGRSGTRFSVVFLLAVVLLGAADQGTWSYSAVLGERYAGMSADAVAVVLAIASVTSLAGVGLSAVFARRLGRLSTIAVLFAVEAAVKTVIAAEPSRFGFSVCVLVWQICFMSLLVQVFAVRRPRTAAGGGWPPPAALWRSAPDWGPHPQAGSSTGSGLRVSAWRSPSRPPQPRCRCFAAFVPPAGGHR